MADNPQKKLDALADRLSSMGSPVMEAGHEVWLAGLGALSVARKEGGKVADQGSKLFDRLVAEGEKFEKKSGKTLRSGAQEAAERLSGAADKAKSQARKAAAKVTRKQSKPLTFHLLPRDDEWTVRREGSDENLSLHSKKQSAVEAARGIARAHAPSHLVVHRADGTVQDTYSYE